MGDDSAGDQVQREDLDAVNEGITGGPWKQWCPVPYPPKRHDHVGQMIFDDDFCCCRGCEQRWFFQIPTQEYNHHRYRMAAGKKKRMGR